TIDSQDRVRLMREVGEALGGLHAMPTHGLAPLVIDWPRFVDAQRDSCRDRQIARGLPASWADAVNGFLARWTPRDDGARALLHTEVMREHVVVHHHEGAWHISGLLDFAESMVGAPEYDFASAGIFLTC